MVRALKGESLPDLVRPPPQSAARAFVMQKVRGVSPEQFIAAVRAAMIELLRRTDIPLDPDPQWRRNMADVWEGRTKEQERLDNARAFLEVVEEAKSYLHGRGLKMPDAETKIAMGFGKKRNGLLKQIKNARKLIAKHEGKAP
jgi:hypothetical protein